MGCPKPGRLFTAVLIPDRSNGEPGYTVFIPALPGCTSQGSTILKAKNAIRDAASGIVSALRARGEQVPEDTGAGRHAKSKTARIERVWVLFHGKAPQVTIGRGYSGDDD